VTGTEVVGTVPATLSTLLSVGRRERHVIPATNIVAIYGTDTEDDPLWSRPVVAFDGGGRPLVLGERGLVAAESFPGFQSLAKSVNHTVIPGDGWIAALPLDDDFLDEATHFLHVPVVAWLIDEDGDGVALIASSDGTTAVWDGPIFHPDQVEAELDPPPVPPSAPGFDPSTLRPRQRPKRPDAN
jgi:hypothetical protein